jgi:hypothetical protein
MRLALLFVLAAGLPVIAQEAKDDDVKKAIKELEGTWVVESAVDSKEDVGSELGMEYVPSKANDSRGKIRAAAKCKRALSRSIPRFLLRRWT